MKWSFAVVSVLFVLFVADTALPADTISVCDTPNWVIAQTSSTPQTLPEKQISDGVYYLLVDRQVKVTPTQTHAYTHMVKKILNAQGVEKASQVYITFDPAYAQLALHVVKINRAEQILDQLQLEKVTLFQRETDLERQLYNGQKTASIILEGTRPGDEIEYAYTISGRNPVFKGNYEDDADTAWDVPLHELTYRWIFSNRRPVFHRTHNCPRSLTIHKNKQSVTYHYKDKMIDAIFSDGDLPIWYSPYPWIQISQFATWQDVARWGAGLYRIPSNLSPALQEKIREIENSSTTTADKIAAALYTVQNEIRYLGIEIGTGSHQPTDPVLTFDRKFGDCKDKTLLLCTILAKFGVQATPALLHTRLQRKIGDLLPSPLAFNHVITKVAVKDSIYWLDPTADCQQQVPLDRQYQAHYGKALVLADDTTALESIGQEELSVPSKEIHETFDLTQGIGKPARFTVKTVCRGREADRLRYEIESSSIQQIVKSYLNFYADDYPSIAAQHPITIEKTPETNTLVITEQYQIPEFWQTSDEGERTEGSFHPDEISALLRKPKRTIRTMPIGLRHPQHITMQTTIKLPVPWEIEAKQFSVENETFAFSYSVTYAHPELILAYDYRTKADFVEADRVASYLADLDKIDDQLGYMIYSYDDAGDEVSWFMLGATLVGVLAALGLAVAAYRYDPPPLPQIDPLIHDSTLKGIGGWLVLLMIGLFVRPLMMIKGFVDLLPTFSQSYWYAFSENIHKGFYTAGRWLVAGEVAANIIFLILFLVLLWLFFKKRTCFPHLFVVVVLSNLAVLLVDTLFGGYLLVQEQWAEPQQIKELVRSAVSSLIWSVYVLKSVRVRQTFQIRRAAPLIRTEQVHSPQNLAGMPLP